MKKCFLRTALALGLSAAALCGATATPDGPPDIPALEKAALTGDAQATFLLGRAYFRGEGVEKNVKKSVQLLQEAAAKGNAEAMDGIGYLYTVGEGIPKDEQKAVEWFRKGAEAGLPKAQWHLGLLLRQGKTIKLSNEESLLWIEKAAAGGNEEAINAIGRIYFSGDKLQKADRAKAIPFLRAAAEAGDPICQNTMGVALRDGAGTEKDLVKAQEWFRKAAQQNNRKAQSNLADLLGVQVPDSPHRKEALKWLLISNAQGEITAKKTYVEIMPKMPSALLASAQKEADQFLLAQRQRANAAKKSENTNPPEGNKAAEKTSSKSPSDAASRDET